MSTTSCVAMGHRLRRVEHDGRWYWRCLYCPHRGIAAPPPEGMPDPFAVGPADDVSGWRW